MYSLGMPVSAIRTKIRQEFEKNRYVSQLNVVDVLLYQSHAEFQVSPGPPFYLWLYVYAYATCGFFQEGNHKKKIYLSLSLFD